MLYALNIIKTLTTSIVYISRLYKHKPTAINIHILVSFYEVTILNSIILI